MTPLVTYTLLLLLFVISSWFIYHIRKDKRANPLDLITTPDTGRLSAAKIGQLTGVLVSTWVVISSASSGKLTSEIFLLYLTYTAGVDLFGKFLRYKQTVPPAAEPVPAEEIPITNKEGE